MRGSLSRKHVRAARDWVLIPYQQEYQHKEFKKKEYHRTKTKLAVPAKNNYPKTLNYIKCEEIL